MASARSSAASRTCSSGTRYRTPLGLGATFTYTLACVNPFRSSARFGLVGVVVVAALMIVAAQTLGQNEAKPKDAFALIFAILGVYLVLLFFLQLRDVSKA